MSHVPPKAGEAPTGEYLLLSQLTRTIDAIEKFKTKLSRPNYWRGSISEYRQNMQDELATLNALLMEHTHVENEEAEA